MDPGFLTCRQEPGDLAEGSMFGHLVEHPAPIHFPNEKEKSF